MEYRLDDPYLIWYIAELSEDPRVCHNILVHSKKVQGFLKSVELNVPNIIRAKRNNILSKIYSNSKLVYLGLGKKCPMLIKMFLIFDYNLDEKQNYRVSNLCLKSLLYNTPITFDMLIKAYHGI